MINLYYVQVDLFFLEKNVKIRDKNIDVILLFHKIIFFNITVLKWGKRQKKKKSTKVWNYNFNCLLEKKKN